MHYYSRKSSASSLDFISFPLKNLLLSAVNALLNILNSCSLSPLSLSLSTSSK